MKPTKHFSNKQEKLIADYLNWAVVVGSGARDFHPGDITSDDWLCECKTHTSSGHDIYFNRDVWKKLSNEAISKFKFPVLFVDDGSQKVENTWCMFPYLSTCAPDSHLVPFDFNSSSVNVKFKHAIVIEQFRSFKQDKDYKHIVFITTIGGHDVGIVPLYEFKSMFVEGY